MVNNPKTSFSALGGQFVFKIFHTGACKTASAFVHSKTQLASHDLSVLTLNVQEHKKYIK